MTIIRASTGSLRLFHFKLTSFILLIGLIDQTNMEMFLDLSTLEGFLMMGKNKVTVWVAVFSFITIKNIMCFQTYS